MLLEYIKNQLLFNDSVTLPGLGSFEIRKRASYIQGKKIIPPGFQIVFNTGKNLDDGILAKSIADAEDIGQDEARQKVLEYIDEVLFALNKGEVFVFEGFGKLFRDPGNVLQFEKDDGYKIDFESSGLESFELDPIEDLLNKESVAEPANIANHEQQGKDTKVSVSASLQTESGKSAVAKPPRLSSPQNTTEKANHESFPSVENKHNRNIFWVLTGAIMILLISFVLIRMTTNLLDGSGLSVFNKELSDDSEIFSEDENAKTESDVNKELNEIIDSMTLQENALTLQETSEPMEDEADESSGYKEFHIIAGSFKDKEKAGILQQSLTGQGYPALVIQQGDQLYRVSAISFKEKALGLQELSRFKQKTKNNAAWLLTLQ